MKFGNVILFGIFPVFCLEILDELLLLLFVDGIGYRPKHISIIVDNLLMNVLYFLDMCHYSLPIGFVYLIVRNMLAINSP